MKCNNMLGKNHLDKYVTAKKGDSRAIPCTGKIIAYCYLEQCDMWDSTKFEISYFCDYCNCKPKRHDLPATDLDDLNNILQKLLDEIS
jgi:hypothetical protein